MHFLLVYTQMRPGGIETLIVRMANWLVTKGHRVTLLLKEPGDLLSLLDEKVEVEVLGPRIFWFFLPFVGRRYLRGYEDKNIDVIYSYCPEGCYFASYVYKYGFRERKPVFLNGIYSPYQFAHRGGIDVLGCMRMHIHLYNVYVDDGSKFFMSEEVRSGNERILGTTVPGSVIWPLPIGVQSFKDIERRVIPYRIVSIGRYIDFKTYNLYMIDVIEELVRDGYDATWEVYGYGRLEDEMRRRVKERKLEGRIFIRGLLPYSEFIKAMAVAHVFVGMGTSLIEAGFCGVPCVPAIMNDAKAITYGSLYNLPYYSCGEILSDDFETVTVASAIRRLFDMTEAEYQAEADRTMQYVKPYSLDLLMQKFIGYVEAAPHIQNIDSYPGWRYGLYCIRWHCFQLRRILAVRTRMRYLMGLCKKKWGLMAGKRWRNSILSK